MTSSSPRVSACATIWPEGAMMQDPPIYMMPSSTPALATQTAQVPLA